jgi:hypothetical protein
MKVVVKNNSKNEELTIYENVKYIDFSSGITILIIEGGNKYAKISEMLSISE